MAASAISVNATRRLPAWTERWASWAPLVGVVALALFINAWGLSKSGYGNTYYAAAVRSMTESWHNFFFGAFDPGGFITVDKPPVFLWIDALSVRAFGYSSWSLLLPSAVAGAIGVGLLWLLVKRYFGVPAATIAALVLALTPIAVAVNRLNLPEPFYVLALVGAAACVLRSLESRRWWTWTIAAGLLVGVAFNTKMLAGWIPGPALALAIVVGVEGKWWLAWRDWAPRLAVLAAVTLLASASWMLIVDNWPASDRPYVGGSSNNTVSDLILGYNGLDRVEGEFGGFGGGAGRGAPPAGFGAFGGGNGGGNTTNPINGAGGIIAGEPDTLRMFDDANGGQIAWFLPFALIGGVVSLWYWRDQRLLRAAALLWLGWVLLFGGVFSYSQGIYHSYYTSALAPGVAALVGIGAVSVSQLARRHPAWLVVGAVMALLTLWVQLEVSGRFDGFFEWLRPFMVIAVLVGLAAFAASVWQRRVPMLAGVSLIVLGLLLMPAAWSGHETANAALNTTLPQAGPRGGASGRSFGSAAFDNGTAQLAAWLQTHDDATARWNLVVSSAMNASTLIADYNLSVMPLGGFSGRDPTLTAADFAALVDSGEARYVLATGAFGAAGFGGGPSFGVPGAGNGGTFGAPGGNIFRGGRQPNFGGRFTPNNNNGGIPNNAAPNNNGIPGGNGNQSNGFPNGGVIPNNGGAFGGLQVPGQPSAIASTQGATAVISAVQRACELVSDPSLPAQYRGQLYDCAGHAAGLSGR
jgi:4-amino-4-deoxy-L-arabinose transferase-like glycosyltransferase